MIVKDEEENLPRLLSSIKGLADEIIVVDTGSKDGTVEIAKKFGAAVHFFEWCDDFSAARNESLGYASKDYIFWLDADDEVPREDHQRIRKRLRKHAGSAFLLKLRSADETGTLDSLQLRIFPNRLGARFEGRVHEQVALCLEKKGVPLRECQATVIHHGYADGTLGREKIKRNLKLLELDVQENPYDITTLFFAAKALDFLGEWDRGLFCLEKILALGEEEPNAFRHSFFGLAVCEKAQALAALGRQAECLAVLEHYRPLLPECRRLRLTLAHHYIQARDHERAFSELSALKGEDFTKEIVPINLAQARREVRHCLGMSALYTGRSDIAEDCFRAAAKEEPAEPSNYAFLSLARERKGDIDGAIDACRRGLAAAAGKGDLPKRLFFLLIRKERLPEALDAYSRLNGEKHELDVVSGRFLIACKLLDPETINEYYQVIQTSLGLQPDNFPGGVPETMKRMHEISNPVARGLFSDAVIFLTNLAT